MAVLLITSLLSHLTLCSQTPCGLWHSYTVYMILTANPCKFHTLDSTLVSCSYLTGYLLLHNVSQAPTYMGISIHCRSSVKNLQASNCYSLVSP
ncbi:hypothetical protein C8R41DRAFT_590652 [Lentinula lateritia]|uniref:Secreted protein n=1 Tax=Lentinula lateritia TaxID=40482 RepID=A0ABQ8V3P6_9AGAR|nr:hypothetical protein C8R41DRAFT_590652 [Lentinula lateritia]